MSLPAKEYTSSIWAKDASSIWGTKDSRIWTESHEDVREGYVDTLLVVNKHLSGELEKAQNEIARLRSQLSQTTTQDEINTKTKSDSDWGDEKLLCSFYSNFPPVVLPTPSFLAPFHSPSVSPTTAVPSLPLSPEVSASAQTYGIPSSSLTPGTWQDLEAKKGLDKAETKTEQGFGSATLKDIKEYQTILLDPKISSWVDGALHCIKPNRKGEQRRLGVLSFIRCVVRKSLGAQVYPHGSFALKTYFNDDEIDISAFFSQAHESTWIQKLVNGLCQEADEEVHTDSRDPLYTVKRVDIIFSKPSTIVKCKIGGLTVNIFDNQLSALGAAALYEHIDKQVGKDHLFKRTFLLVKAWGRKCGIIGSQKGIMSQDCLRALVFYLFNAYHHEIRTPLEGFFKLLHYLEHFEWDTHALTAFGPAELSGFLDVKPESITKGLETWPTDWEPLITPTVLRKYMMQNNKPRSAKQKTMHKSLSAPRSLSSLTSLPVLPSSASSSCLTSLVRRGDESPKKLSSSASSGSLSSQHLLLPRKSGRSRLSPNAKVFCSKAETTSDSPTSEGDMDMCPVNYLRSSINVLDPVDPSRNLGVTVSYKNEFKIRRAFSQGATELRQAVLDVIREKGLDHVRADTHPILRLCFQEDVLSSYQNKRIMDSKDKEASESFSRPIAPTKVKEEMELPILDDTSELEAKFGLVDILEDSDPSKDLMGMGMSSLRSSGKKKSSPRTPSSRTPSSLTPSLTPSSSFSDIKSDLTFSILDGNLEKMLQNLSHARQFQTPDISEDELVLLIQNILLEKGSVPVGRMGSLLHEVTNNHSLPAMVKEHYGGLKRLLERHPEEFTIGKDHPYNPHVRLRVASPSSIRTAKTSSPPVTSHVGSAHPLLTSPALNIATTPSKNTHRPIAESFRPFLSTTPPGPTTSSFFSSLKSSPMPIPIDGTGVRTSLTSRLSPPSHLITSTPPTIGSSPTILAAMHNGETGNPGHVSGYSSTPSVLLSESSDPSQQRPIPYHTRYEAVGDVSTQSFQARGGAISAATTRGRKRRTRTRHTSDRKVLTSCLAMDCEMVGVGPLGVRSVLARCTIVNYYGDTVYDKYVKPMETITDYRTEKSGIQPGHVTHEQAVDFKQAQREVAAIIKNRVLIGHSLANDLQALVLSHPKHLLRDTAHCKLLCPRRPLPLKTLVKEILGVDIQVGIHDSVEDARSALGIYKTVKADWEKMYEATPAMTSTYRMRR